jgi:hypothetical protein
MGKTMAKSKLWIFLLIAVSFLVMASPQEEEGLVKRAIAQMVLGIDSWR